jgi:hypothetical protein
MAYSLQYSLQKKTETGCGEDSKMTGHYGC